MDRAFVSKSVMWYVDVGADLNDTHTVNENTPVTQTLLTCPGDFFADERLVSQTPRTPTLWDPATAGRQGVAHRLAQPKKQQRLWRTRQTTSGSIGALKPGTQIFA